MMAAVRMYNKRATLRLLWKRQTSPSNSYSSIGGFLSRFRKKKVEDEDTVVVSGHLELTPSQSVPFEYEKPAARSRRYTPPDDIEKQVESQLRHVLGTSLPNDWLEIKLEDRGQKFFILAGLSHKLQHSIPSSRLHLMKTPHDILDFYKTPVKDTSKFDDLASVALPPNLRIRWGYE